MKSLKIKELKRLSLAALLIASATFVACTSDDNIIEEQPAQPAEPQTYTMTVQASKGGDEAGARAITRALSLNGSTLNATWAASDEVKVYDNASEETGTLTAQSSGTSTTLSGSLDWTPSVGAKLTLAFLSENYSGQDGTLDYIASHCDYATATVDVKSVDETAKTITTTPANFENQQAIVKFTLKNGDNTVNPTTLTVSDGTKTTTLTDIPDATYETNGNGVLYVALPGFDTQTVTLTAYDGSANAYVYAKNNVTFDNGHYYGITVKMKQAVNLATLTGDYEAKDGEALAGTLTNNVKISIADGATVTLQDATINGVHDEDNYQWAGITCLGDATITIQGTNTVNGFYNSYPGIFVPVDKTLTIQGKGKLTASSNGFGAGIGGGLGINCGNINITGGTINATGGTYCAGIGGGGNNASCGSITITNGVTSVTATKGEEAPNSIGAGNNGTCGTVTIGGTEGSITTSPYTYQP